MDTRNEDVQDAAAQDAPESGHAPRLGVTGATGLIGGGVSRELERRGVGHRLLVRSPQKVADRVEASNGLLEAAAADWARPEQLAEALAGLDTVLMVSITEAAAREQQQKSFVEAAKQAGVRHLVYLSFANPGPEATFTFARTHGATEEQIRASGLDWTFLRDDFYLDVLADFADAEGVIRGPAEDGRVAAVARADVIEATAAVLSSPQEHRGKTYTLTGPEALTLTEAAQIMSEATGKSYRFENETLEQAHASRESYNPEPWEMEAWISTYTAIRAGELAEVTEDVERLTGHRPRSLREVMSGQRIA